MDWRQKHWTRRPDPSSHTPPPPREQAASRPDDFAQVFGGNRLLPGSEPAAHCYAGHQFGNFAGQLGVSVIA
jgi:hypothetical protein